MTTAARPGARAATIEDVAARAGVSRAAVSKVIRDAYGVSDNMREQVNRAIAELGYRPRVAARAMRGSTFTIGVQLPQLENGFFTRILDGVVRALDGSGYHIIISPMVDAKSSTEAIESLLDRQVDGMLVVAPGAPQSWLEELGQRVPLVQIGQHDDPDHYDVVIGDDVAGAGMVMDHLLGAGHTRIAHLTSDERLLAESRTDPHLRRLGAYERAMTSRGLIPDVVRIPATPMDAYAATQKILDRAVRPTALFAGHDALALAALRAVAERGLDFSDFAVVGYDDIPLADHPLISLTTVDQSGEEMGAAAARMLLERIGGRTAAEKRVFTPKLLVRATSRDFSA